MVSLYYVYQLDLVATLQRIGHRMYVNRAYRCQWVSASPQCHPEAGEVSFP
jgi:hypothetical protein